MVGGKSTGVDFYSRKNGIRIEIANHYLIGCGNIDGVFIKGKDLLDVGDGPLDWR